MATMREREAECVLFVRAVEESDPEGRILALGARRAASERCLDLPDAVVRRAELLLETLSERFERIGALLEAARLGGPLGPTVWLAALGVGAATNLVGPGRQVNLLAFPLMGIVAWNLAVYLANLAGRLAGAGVNGPAGRLARALTGRATLPSRIARRFPLAEEDDRRVLAGALGRFANLWQAHAGRLLAARMRRILHLAALGMALGAVGGMYVRGITLEYRAVWESTWLQAEQVQALLGRILGPASSLSGIAIPDVVALRGPGPGGDAAPWIHLWALTVALFVVVPRGALALFASLRCARLGASIPLDLEAPYYRRLFRSWRGEAVAIELIPYSHEPSQGTRSFVENALYDRFGSRADLRWAPPLGYGQHLEPAEEVAEGAHRGWVVLFNLAQTPEAEVHGTFVVEIRARAAARGGWVTVVLDAEPFVDRVPSPARLEERTRAWRRVVAEAGLEPVRVSPDRSTTATDQLVDALAGAGE